MGRPRFVPVGLLTFPGGLLMNNSRILSDTSTMSAMVSQIDHIVDVYVFYFGLPSQIPRERECMRTCLVPVLTRNSAQRHDLSG